MESAKTSTGAVAAGNIGKFRDENPGARCGRSRLRLCRFLIIRGRRFRIGTVCGQQCVFAARDIDDDFVFAAEVMEARSIGSGDRHGQAAGPGLGIHRRHEARQIGAQPVHIDPRRHGEFELQRVAVGKGGVGNGARPIEDDSAVIIMGAKTHRKQIGGRLARRFLGGRCFCLARIGFGGLNGCRGIRSAADIDRDRIAAIEGFGGRGTGKIEHRLAAIVIEARCGDVMGKLLEDLSEGAFHRPVEDDGELISLEPDAMPDRFFPIEDEAAEIAVIVGADRDLLGGARLEAPRLGRERRARRFSSAAKVRALRSASIGGKDKIHPACELKPVQPRHGIGKFGKMRVGRAEGGDIARIAVPLQGVGNRRCTGQR